MVRTQASRKPGTNRRALYTTRTRIGFYGCWRLDRVIRVGEKEKRTMPILHTVCIDCPCGERHEAVILWRKLKRREDLQPEVLV
jgi:hypothetical protein